MKRSGPGAREAELRPGQPRVRALLLISLVAACSAPSTPVTSVPVATAVTPAEAEAAADASTVPGAVGPMTASPKVTLLAELPGWDVTPLPNRLVVIDDGLLAVTAIDAATGARAWQQVLQRKPAGRHTLHPTGGSVLAWFGEKIHVLDGTTGKLVVSYAAAINGVPWHDGGCGLDVVEGVCAERCQCSFQVRDCLSGAKRGKRYEKVYMEMWDPDGSRSSGCWGGGGDLLGNAAGYAIFSAEDHVPGHHVKDAPTVTGAIELATGRETWRLPLQPSSVAYASGHTPDGKTCWFSGGTDGLTVVDCATGRHLWATAATTAGRHLVGHVASRGLFELRGSTAVMLEERTGKRIWTTTLAPDTLAWTRGADQPTDWDLRSITSIAILDPSSGKVLATVRIPKGADIHRDRRGGFVVATDIEVVAYDDAGAVTGRAGLVRPKLTFGDTLVIATTPTELIVLVRGTLHELARIPGKFASIHVEGPLGANRLAGFTYDAKTVGKVRLFRIDPDR